MNTPPGLLGCALAFWGWQTGLLPFAVPMALGLEVSRLVAWRWDLTAADARRVADLCRVILVAMAVSLGATRGPAPAVLGLIEWFPLAVLPLLVCQAYGTGDRIDLRTFFLILRRRRANDEEPVNLAYPYLVICIGAASAANVRSWGFLRGDLRAGGLGAVADPVSGVRVARVGRRAGPRHRGGVRRASRTPRASGRGGEHRLGLGLRLLHGAGSGPLPQLDIARLHRAAQALRPDRSPGRAGHAAGTRGRTAPPPRGGLRRLRGVGVGRHGRRLRASATAAGPHHLGPGARRAAGPDGPTR